MGGVKNQGLNQEQGKGGRSDEEETEEENKERGEEEEEEEEDEVIIEEMLGEGNRLLKGRWRQVGLKVSSRRPPEGRQTADRLGIRAGAPAPGKHCWGGVGDL